ncbi:hypothetical protein CPC08DRAFT_692109 [Agrocybe pediades]|nr:hypothetical protein CPC08DRAFT_692109 [Agrocybe pediades]
MRGSHSFKQLLPVVLASLSLATASFNDPIPFSPGFDVQAVLDQAVSLPTHSWEYGTASEALLELYTPLYSVYGAVPFPAPFLNPQNTPSLAYAKQKIVIAAPPNGLSDGDGAVGDPASLGVAAFLLGKTDPAYAAAAKAEAEYVISGAPRWFNGAISHRADHPEPWADFIYMAPPFLAYYGAATHNATFLREGVEQITLYRDVLVANTTTGTASPPSSHPAEAAGLWTHILSQWWSEPGIWASGNGWAAAGSMRVLATLLKAPFGVLTTTWKQNSIQNIVKVVTDILDGAMRMPTDPDQGGLLRNYLDDPTWFGEVSGSSLLASVAYRLATLSSTYNLIPRSKAKAYVAWAENIRNIIATGHIVNGTATPAVNPLNWGDRNEFTTGSPEGQNFVILMYAAWRDCVKAGVSGCRV